MQMKPEPLRIRLRRLNPRHHRFEALRSNGEVEVRELETRSFLTHDLIHYALEAEAGLRQSFYGRIASGGDYEDLGPPMTGEALAVERVVGPLQSAIKGEVDPETFVARTAAWFCELGETPPAWLNVKVIAGALERLRELEGRWRATPFGETMELEFPPPA